MKTFKQIKNWLFPEKENLENVEPLIRHPLPEMTYLNTDLSDTGYKVTPPGPRVNALCIKGLKITETCQPHYEYVVNKLVDHIEMLTSINRKLDKKNKELKAQNDRQYAIINEKNLIIRRFEEKDNVTRTQHKEIPVETEQKEKRQTKKEKLKNKYESK